MEKYIPKAGQVYRHYKGKIYKIICFALHTERNEFLVIYHDITDTSLIFARPLSVFMGRAQPEGAIVPTPRFRLIKDADDADGEWDNA